MENVSGLDLNTALRSWMEKLSHSPHFQSADIAELESHVRDSMSQLQSHGLSSEESFLVATRRVGGVDKLEPEFAKVNSNPWNKIIHGLVLAFLAGGCFFLWSLLMIVRMLGIATGELPMPAFSALMLGLKDYLALPPLLALAYCFLVWTGKLGSRNSWMGFFAVSAGTLILLATPTIVALLLPIINALHHLLSK